MASVSEIAANKGKCPDCLGGFAKAPKGRKFRRHLKKLPKLDRKTGKIILKNGKPVYCGGTSKSWGKGHED
jgi:hypothetical protein